MRLPRDWIGQDWILDFKCTGRTRHRERFRDSRFTRSSTLRFRLSYQVSLENCEIQSRFRVHWRSDKSAQPWVSQMCLSVDVLSTSFEALIFHHFQTSDLKVKFPCLDINLIQGLFLFITNLVNHEIFWHKYIHIYSVWINRTPQLLHSLRTTLNS